MQRTAVMPGRTGGASVRKQPASNSKAHGTKQPRKVDGENVASKPAESPSRVAKRNATALTVSATKSGAVGSADGSDVRSSRRPEKQSRRSGTSGGQREARRVQQRSVVDLTASTPHVDSNQQTDEKVSTILYVHVFVSMSCRFRLTSREFALLKAVIPYDIFTCAQKLTK